MAARRLAPVPKKWLALLLILAVMSPIGILLVWNYGDAWGEWGEVGSWTPRQYWSAPLPDYNMGGWEGQLRSSIGYIISAIVGIAVIIGVTYLLSVTLARGGREGAEK
jgi:cobalt/nickel transport protein